MVEEIDKETVETRSGVVKETVNREPEQVFEEPMVGKKSTATETSEIPFETEPVVEEQSTEADTSKILVKTTTEQQ